MVGFNPLLNLSNVEGAPILEQFLSNSHLQAISIVIRPLHKIDWIGLFEDLREILDLINQLLPIEYDQRFLVVVVALRIL